MDDSGFILTGLDLGTANEPPAGWPLARAPLLLETSLPGVFAWSRPRRSVGGAARASARSAAPRAPRVPRRSASSSCSVARRADAGWSPSRASASTASTRQLAMTAGPWL